MGQRILTLPSQDLEVLLQPTSSLLLCIRAIPVLSRKRTVGGMYKLPKLSEDIVDPLAVSPHLLSGWVLLRRDRLPFGRVGRPVLIIVGPAAIGPIAGLLLHLGRKVLGVLITAEVPIRTVQLGWGETRVRIWRPGMQRTHGKATYWIGSEKELRGDRI